MKNEIIVIGELHGGPWDARYNQTRLVFSAEGISPTLHTMAGGGTEIKIIVEENSNEQKSI